MNNLSLFLIGMPRSGTKLLRSLLNNHKEVFIPEVETLFIPDLLKKYGENRLTLEMVDNVITDLKKSLFFFYYLQSRSFDFDRFKCEDLSIKEFLDLFFTELAIQENQDVKWVGDKSPNYIYEVKLLMSFYPNAKFIHIVRDPRDYALSMRKTWNKNIYRAAYRWSHGMREIYNIPQNKAANSIIEIKYEDLIKFPQITLQKVCDFIGLEFQPDMTELNQSVELIGDARGKQIDSANSQKYLSELTEKEQLKIEKLTAKFLRHYGYPISDSVIYLAEVSKFKELCWKLGDAYNLILFNVQKYGFINGLNKLIKAAKHL